MERPTAPPEERPAVGDNAPAQPGSPPEMINFSQGQFPEGAMAQLGNQTFPLSAVTDISYDADTGVAIISGDFPQAPYGINMIRADGVTPAEWQHFRENTLLAPAMERPAAPDPAVTAAAAQPSAPEAANEGFTITCRDSGPYSVNPHVMECQQAMAELKALGVEGIDLGSYGANGDGCDGKAGPMTGRSVIAAKEALGIDPADATITPEFMEQMQVKIAELEAGPDLDTSAPAQQTRLADVYDPAAPGLALGQGQMAAAALTGAGLNHASLMCIDPGNGQIGPEMTVAGILNKPEINQTPVPRPDLQSAPSAAFTV